MNRFLLAGVLVLGLLIAPAVIAVGEAQPRYGGTFVTAIPYEEIIGLDPLRLTIWNGSSVGVIIQIHEGAVKWNTTTLEIEPALAESWQLSEDARIYTLHVRKGAKFHNGREVVAQDFKYSFERMMDPELGGLSTYLFSGVVGVDEYVAGTADEISGIVVVSASELRVTLKQIDVSFLHNLCEPGAVIVPQEEVDAIGLDAFNRDPVGAGPFKFGSWIGNEITLEVFDATSYEVIGMCRGLTHVLGKAIVETDLASHVGLAIAELETDVVMETGVGLVRLRILHQGGKAERVIAEMTPFVEERVMPWASSSSKLRV